MHVMCSLFVVATLTACSIHPVQQDVTGIPTKAVVERIRCEARLAVLDKAIGVLRHTADGYRKDGKLSVAEKFDIAANGLQSQRGSIAPIIIDPRSLPTERARAFYGRYINTAIAYDFLMQGVENNRVGLSVDPLRLITNGTAGITIGGSGEVNRDNQRHFSVSDTFGELLFNRMQCSPDYLPENFIYPVSGRVGLREVVDTFIDLNEDKELYKFDNDRTVFADTLKFTTTWTGAATPHVQIDPVGTRFGLTPSNIALSASRADTHTLTIGLAMGPPQAIPLLDLPLPLALRQRSAVASRIQQSNKNNAFEAIQQLRIRSFLDRAGTLIVR